jgi:hypothetical protein
VDCQKIFKFRKNPPRWSQVVPCERTGGWRDSLNPLNAELISICHLLILLGDWSVHRKYIPIYIQQDATSHSLFISGNCSTCFGWYFHPSSGAHTTLSTESGICHTVTAICRYHGRVGGLSVLWVAYATHSTLKPVSILPR